jgi:hypothetical protein
LVLNRFSATGTEILERGPPFLYFECERLLLAQGGHSRSGTNWRPNVRIRPPTQHICNSFSSPRTDIE